MTIGYVSMNNFSHFFVYITSLPHIFTVKYYVNHGLISCELKVNTPANVSVQLITVFQMQF